MKYKHNIFDLSKMREYKDYLKAIGAVNYGNKERIQRLERKTIDACEAMSNRLKSMAENNIQSLKEITRRSKK